MNSDKISIIIPMHNVEKYVLRCINSIINQSYKNLEIIIIDDGSTDNTVNEVKKIKDNRIKLIIKENQGVSEARNTGLALVTGKYLCFVDADDWLEEKYIEKMYSIMIHEDVDCIRCNYYRNYDEYISYDSQNLIKDLYNIKIMQNTNMMQKVMENFYLERMPCFVWLLFIKKELLCDNNILFEKNIAMMEDTLFFMEILLKCKSIYFCDTPLYHYFCNNDSATKSINNIERNILSRLVVLNKIKNLFFSNNYSFKECEINTVHIRAILNYVYKLSIYDIKRFRHVYLNLQRNDDFIKIIHNINYTNLKIQDKIQVILFRKKMFNILMLYLKIRKTLKAIKNLILKRKE